MHPTTIIIDFDAIRREVYENAIDSSLNMIDDNYIKNCFLKNLLSLLNIMKFRIKICHNKNNLNNIDITSFFQDAGDIEYVEIENIEQKISLLLENDCSVLIDDYDKYFECAEYENMKYRIILLKRKWNVKSFHRYSYIMDTKDNNIYVIDVENKLTMSFPKFLTILFFKS